MTFKIEVFDTDDYADEAAQHIVDALPGGGSLVLTGGTTAEKIYPRLAGKRPWSNVDFTFSDERCVPPDDVASNYGMARRLFLEAADATTVHRMKGELPPEEGAADYDRTLQPIVHHGFDLMLLGMGADNHVGALFPGSDALDSDRLCEAVERPDGLMGLTLTPTAMLSARKVLLLVTGEAKAEAVAAALDDSAQPLDRPVRLLADHPDATFLLDRGSASRL